MDRVKLQQISVISEQNLQCGAATVKKNMSISLPTHLHELIWLLNVQTELQIWKWV